MSESNITPPFRSTGFTAFTRLRRATLAIAVVAAGWSAGLLTHTALAQEQVAAVQPAGMPVVKTGHTFVYRPNGTDPASVNLAGSFNGWSGSATPMTKNDDGTWSVHLPLDEGIYTYKFVVNGNDWKPDPNGDKDFEEDDTFGGKNSGVLVGPDGRKLPPSAPNAILDSVIRHDPNDIADVNVVSSNLLRVGLRVQAGDVPDVSIVYSGTKPDEWLTQPLSSVQTRYGYERFGGLIRTNGSPVSYYFALRDGTQTTLLAKSGVVAAASLAQTDPFKVDIKPAFETPDWAKSAVWYQIFPERFRNGDPSNDPDENKFQHVVKWTSDWWKAQPGETPGAENFYKGTGNVWKRRYGGDVQGLKQELPYLRSLGITALYLNPMFEAESMHKYDTADYRHIDDNFGVKGDLAQLISETDDPATWQWSASDKIFLDFVDEAHKQGFKVVLDGVFNHVGRAHPFFQDVVKNGRASHYADWFEIEDFGTQTPADPEQFGKPGGMKFKAWDQDSGHLPVFRKNADQGLATGPYEHVMAVTKRWLAPDGDPSRGVDGFRLDVANDIPHPFWVAWRKTVKTAKPDAYISGEIWTFAQPWLKGDQFDGVMNYQFAMPAQSFFVNRNNAIKPSQFADRLSQVAYAYPFQASLAQMNLFDSHDTDRLASMFVNPDRAYDASNRIQDNGPDYSSAKPDDTQWTRLKQAVALQMTFVGAPMTYYGDEVGMWSPDDPSNRQPMVWKDLQPYENPEVAVKDDLFDFYQHAIAVRRALPALQLGFFRPVKTDDAAGTFSFVREYDGRQVYVVLNRSDKEQTIELPVSGTAPLFDWLSGKLAPTDANVPDARPTVSIPDTATGLTPENGNLHVTLPPYGSAVLAPK